MAELPDNLHSVLRRQLQRLGVADLDWEVVGSDDEKLEITCRKKGGLLGGTATIQILVDGPEGIPSATVNVKSTTEGGLLNRDKANVAEFVKPFHRRVC